MTPTLDQIEAARSPKGGFTRESLQKLGIGWPPPRGWLKKLLRQAGGGKITPSEPQRAAPKSARTIKIIFDGGTSCNIPAKGYGNGYGSYKRDDEPVYRCEFRTPMSANAAEVMTALHAIRAFNLETSDWKAETDLHFQGDSQIALKWIRNYRSKAKPSQKSSQEFRNVIALIHFELKAFRSVKADWWPRSNSLRIFGH